MDELEVVTDLRKLIKEHTDGQLSKELYRQRRATLIESYCKHVNKLVAIEELKHRISIESAQPMVYEEERYNWLPNIAIFSIFFLIGGFAGFLAINFAAIKATCPADWSYCASQWYHFFLVQITSVLPQTPL